MADDKKSETPPKVGVDHAKLLALYGTVNRAWQQNTALDLVEAYRKLSTRNVQSALTKELLVAKQGLETILGVKDEEEDGI